MKYSSLIMMIGLGATTILSGCSSKAERQFMKGCTQMSEGEVCSCIYDKLEDKYGEEQLLKEFYSMEPNKAFQEHVVSVTMQCAQET